MRSPARWGRDRQAQPALAAPATSIPAAAPITLPAASSSAAGGGELNTRRRSRLAAASSWTGALAPRRHLARCGNLGPVKRRQGALAKEIDDHATIVRIVEAIFSKVQHRVLGQKVGNQRPARRAPTIERNDSWQTHYRRRICSLRLGSGSYAAVNKFDRATASCAPVDDVPLRAPAHPFQLRD